MGTQSTENLLALNHIEENEEILGRGRMCKKMKVQKEGIVRIEESVKNKKFNINTYCSLQEAIEKEMPLLMFHP